MKSAIALDGQTSTRVYVVEYNGGKFMTNHESELYKTSLPEGRNL